MRANPLVCGQDPQRSGEPTGLGGYDLRAPPSRRSRSRASTSDRDRDAPRTLADTLESAVKLMREKAHAHIKINLDFLHLWEAGCPPLEAYRLLKVWTVNYHLKNISDIGRLDIYKPENVYSPSGDMRGTASLARGVINYGGLFDCLERDGVPHPLSLEWFGERPSQYLQAEMMWLRRQTLSAAPNNNQYGIEGARP
ncbi:sugar phosphate isomerase/epimerase family protein [Cohnella hashimotonis]|uniref:TIM barrel protein n=1 Tax=Cohnella hashimotonis TaxID=2826895 RepID=A0ABT6TE64_9BACL|nr:TIM barrel protein [Cohnella hashimotonis]MDI4645124.1 TIM barrel protein [Cohnella hashimotonis]